MNLIQKKMDEIKPYQKNARLHSDEQIRTILQSIKSLGFNDPIEIDEEGMIISGPARFEAAKQLGLETIPAIVHAHFTDAKKKAYILAANKIQMNSTWDENILRGELHDLVESDFDVTLTGFSIDELNNLLEEVKVEEEFCDEDDCPAPEVNPITKLGDVWILGNHRVMCGDATSPGNVEVLTRNSKIDILFTDPPYNVSHESRSEKHGGIKNDDLSTPEFNEFMKEFCSIIISLVNPDCYYIWCNWKFYSILHTLLPFTACIVWAKNSFGLGIGYRHQHEFCLFNGKIDAAIKNESDLWEVSRDTDYVHPTQKPVGLAMRALNNHKDSLNILDLFGGSGSTLIACQKLGKTCFMMELDEKYVDVIVKRWQNFTNKKAVLESTGEEFTDQ